MKRIRRLVILSALLIAGAAFWFLGVDWSWFEEQCPDCGYGQSIGQYRVFTVPIHTDSREHKTVFQRISSDLGVPCQHERSYRWHKHRWWGLCYCAYPCVNGITRLVGDDSWYDSEMAAKVRAIGEARPGLGDEFHQRVFVNHDIAYARAFVSRIRQPPDK